METPTPEVCPTHGGGGMRFEPLFCPECGEMARGTLETITGVGEFDAVPGGARGSENGCSVNRAFVPPSMKRRPLVKHDAAIVAVEFFPRICSEPYKYW